MDLDILETMAQKAKELGHTVEIISHIKSGKEALVYRVLLDDKLVAMKVYKDPAERSFKKADAYLNGKFYRSASARKSIAKKNKFGRKLKQDNWIKREFFMLQKFFETGASIPKPLLLIDSAIFMELLGNNETAAPRLIEVDLTAKEAVAAFDTVIESMEIFWNLGVVHGDLSAYNILWWNTKPYVIDFPQSIDARTHPGAREILERDLQNLTKYFSKYMSVDFEQVKNRFS